MLTFWSRIFALFRTQTGFPYVGSQITQGVLSGRSPGDASLGRQLEWNGIIFAAILQPFSGLRGSGKGKRTSNKRKIRSLAARSSTTFGSWLP
jgi:hypothetical protein